jgi:hypothetical protein
MLTLEGSAFGHRQVLDSMQPGLAGTKLRPHGLLALVWRCHGARREEEGEHRGPWSLAGEGSDLRLGAELFCDGRIFDPAHLNGYADQVASLYTGMDLRKSY